MLEIFDLLPKNMVKSIRARLEQGINKACLEFENMKKEWGGETITFQYTTEPKEGLLPLEIWVSIRSE